MKAALYIVLFLFIIPFSYANAQSRYIKHYSFIDGLAGNRVYMCTQDTLGNLWICTTSGISKFNGRSFTNYTYDDGLINNEILFAHTDHLGRLWLNTYSARPSFSIITQDSILNYQNSKILSTLPNNAIITEGFTSKETQTTCLTGYGGIVYLKGEKEPIIRKVKPYIISAPFETYDHKIWVGTNNVLFEIIDSGKTVHKQLLDDDSLILEYAFFNNMLYVLKEHSVELYEYTNNTFKLFKTVLLEQRVKLLVVNEYGTWLTYDNKEGAYFYEGHTFESLPQKINVNATVNYIYQDTEDNIWLCTLDDGLYFIPNILSKSYSYTDGLMGSMPQCIYPTSATSIWVGYYSGYVQLLKLKGNNVSVLKQLYLGDKVENDNFIVDIAIDGDSVYFLTNHSLFLYSDNKLKKIFDVTGKSMTIIEPGTIGLGSVTYKVIKNGITTNTYKTGNIYDAQPDRSGNLWLAGLKGVFYVEKKSKKIKKISAFKGIYALAVSTKDNFIWVGTQSNGLLLLKNDKPLKVYTTNNSPLVSNTIRSITTNNNKVVIGSNSGVSQLVYDYANLHIDSITTIDHRDGIISSEVNDIKTYDNVLFIATNKGISTLKNIQNKNIPYKPPVIRINNSIIQPTTDPVRANYSKDGIIIEFQTPAYRYSSNLSYRYTLSGFDNQYYTTQNNEARYTNLPPGDYSFIIKANDTKRNTSAPRTIYITITPKYWQTLWFKISVIALISTILLLIAYYRKRTLNLNTQKKLKNEKIIAQTQLAAIKAQIKPHFIYNTLNAIKDFIYNRDKDTAGKLIIDFAKLIRKGFHMSDQDFTSISEDSDFIRRYLELERNKCENCFTYDIQVDHRITETRIPSLLTQPFIENAVIHGVRNLENNSGHISINYQRYNSSIICTIEDNGIGYIVSQQQKKIRLNPAKGLAISKERIEYFKVASDIDISLSIKDKSVNSDKNISGTIVIITVNNLAKLI